MPSYDYDLIVIGGGAAGLSTAYLAANLGVKTALVDKGNLGGDCLHYGCIPSKTLIHAAKLAHIAQNSQSIGIHCQNTQVDFPAIMKRIQTVIRSIAAHADNPKRYEDMGVTVLTQTNGCFINDHTIEVGHKKISGKKIVIAAGTRPRTLDLPGLSDVGYLTNENFFSLEKQPKSLLIIGSGPIGCELAQAMQRLGTKVTLVNRSNTLLRKEDPDVQKYMKKKFTEEGIDMLLGVKLLQVTKSRGKKILRYKKGRKEETVQADEILVAIGRTSNADGIEVQNAGVKLDERGYIVTNRKLQTSKKHIYAAGDITGHLQFTHAASHEAGVVISNAILHVPKKINLDDIPRATFTDPEVASTGLNETEASRRKIPHTTSIYSWKHQDRAQTDNTNGFTKLILGKKDKILGVQIVGPHAGELIHEWIVARAAGMKLSTLSQLTHVYPTLSGSNGQAASAYVGSKLFTPTTRRVVRHLFRYRNTKIDA